MEVIQNNIKHIVFDVGGVLITNQDKNIYQIIASELGIGLKILMRAIDAQMNNILSGHLTETEFWKIFCQQTKCPTPVNPKSYFAKHFSPIINEAVMDIAKKLHELGYQLAILSDAVPSHQQKVEALPELNLFSPRLYSFNVKSTKQTTQPFIALAQTLHASPQSIVFIDDKKNNTQNAATTGCIAIHFTSPQALLAKLTRLNLFST
jgi:HAD superfamily hydrolase (TIGR01509 family)